MKRTSLFIILIAALILASCAVLRSSPAATEAPALDYSRSSEGAPAQPEFFAPDMPLPAATAMPPSAGDGNLQTANAERLVIQNADLAVVVSDVEARMKAIESMASEMGGFVVSSNLYQSYTSDFVEVPEASIVIRVPAERLEEALERIKQDVVEVQTENRSGTDVTDQYVDLQSQLKAKQAAEAKLLEIMEDARTTEDVLAVYQTLQAIQTEIEVLTGQINYLEQSAALSAISIRLIAEETIQEIKVAGWEPKGVALEAIQDLVHFLQDFADFLIGFFLRDLWIILLVALPFYVVFLIGRAVYRRVRAGRMKKEITPPPAEK
jgi:hypothetical protein